MRLHSSIISPRDIWAAARVARADVEFTCHKSRKRDTGFEVRLTGESKRRPNFYKGDGEFAATWDQWGVFFGYLYNLDPNLICGSAYKDAAEFDFRTNNRFNPDSNDRAPLDGTNLWPADAHGDHRFKFQGVPYEQSCVKCSAVQRWQ